MSPKDVDAIVIHCSSTPEGDEYFAADIDLWHKKKGWKMIGYHYVVDIDGTVEKGRPTTMQGAHTSTSGLSGKPYNSHSIGICYIGGLAATTNDKGKIIPKEDSNGNYIAKDTRTLAQKRAMHDLVLKLMDEFPNIKEVIGHRDASPDKNLDGKIEKNEWIKACPCFDVKAEFPIAVCPAKRN